MVLADLKMIEFEVRKTLLRNLAPTLVYTVDQLFAAEVGGEFAATNFDSDLIAVLPVAVHRRRRRDACRRLLDVYDEWRKNGKKQTDEAVHHRRLIDGVGLIEEDFDTLPRVTFNGLLAPVAELERLQAHANEKVWTAVSAYGNGRVPSRECVSAFDDYMSAQTRERQLAAQRIEGTFSTVRGIVKRVGGAVRAPGLASRVMLSAGETTVGVGSKRTTRDSMTTAATGVDARAPTGATSRQAAALAKDVAAFVATVAAEEHEKLRITESSKKRRRVTRAAPVAAAPPPPMAVRAGRGGVQLQKRRAATAAADAAAGGRQRRSKRARRAPRNRDV
jgi:hypothetical protein